MKALALIELMRPRQWVKNGFVLIGLLFGHAWSDAPTVIAVLYATLSFCLASGAVYAFNDARDAEQDRHHPDKRHRPVARGSVSPGQAMLLAIAAVIAALAVACIVGGKLAAIVAGYLDMSAAYSLGLKRVPVLDVVIISAGFMLRLLAGTLGVGIEPSAWLIACGFLLTLFLGFGKRRAEIRRLDEEAGQHRPVLDAYSVVFLDRAITFCAAGMTIAYAAYTLSPDTAALHGGSLVLTLPWVLLGTSRYLFRLRKRGGGGDPAEELLRDPFVAGAAAGWITTVCWLIG
jgi:4-hydroxybenzoate polyprenyltransferase